MKKPLQDRRVYSGLVWLRHIHNRWRMAGSLIGAALSSTAGGISVGAETSAAADQLAEIQVTARENRATAKRTPFA
jgi:hypothetical protein